MNNEVEKILIELYSLEKKVEDLSNNHYEVLGEIKSTLQILTVLLFIEIVLTLINFVAVVFP